MTAKYKTAASRYSGRLIACMGLGASLAVAAHAQTDVAASLYGAFNQTATGNNTVQSPSNAAGALFEVRHIANPLVGYEATYSINRANQTYSNSSVACPVLAPQCDQVYGAVSANAHEVTGDWLVSAKLANLRPFALAGGGVLFNEPQNGRYTGARVPTPSSLTTNSSTKAVFVYGAGLDWTLLPHLGLRLQYRGNLYKAPALTNAFTSTGAFTRTSEPMIGAFFRF